MAWQLISHRHRPRKKDTANESEKRDRENWLVLPVAVGLVISPPSTSSLCKKWGRQTAGTQKYTHNHSPAPATYSSALQCESGIGIVGPMPGSFLHTNSDISPTGAVGRSLEIWIKESENGARRQIGGSNGGAKLTTLSDKERDEVSVPIRVNWPQKHTVLMGMNHRLLSKSPKMRILSSCLHPHINPNLYDSFIEHKRRYLGECRGWWSQLSSNKKYYKKP